MGLFRKSGYAHLMAGAAAGALLFGSGAAWAQTKPITIAPQTLASALHDFGSQTGRQIFFKPELTAAKTSQGVSGATDEQVALAEILEGTGLTFRREANAFIIEQEGSGSPQGGSAAGGGATVEALIVTAQKREEDIQDVPIAISAFSQEDLTTHQIAGGPDLMTQVPNMTFTKTNFTSYSIQIRGIGTQAISATTDAAVAVAFNNTPFIQNHFFEQEFYDLERVEVLRGPQGTLYGRNATAGVVNLISAKPKFYEEAKVSADIANYNTTRIEGMINLPLVEDMVALRLAGEWTKRDGYAFNQITGKPIDGRDLWSTRASLRFTPSDRIDANLIWEHFEESDDRLRSGKQLCHTDEVTEVAGFPTTHFQTLAEYGQSLLFTGVQGTFSQGCAPESLYSPDSFQTPNGLSLPYYGALSVIGLPTALTDPYVSRSQSRDLRVIESTVDPGYFAKSDVVELQANIDLTDNLSLASETAWVSDWIFSTQDFNRFNTASGAWSTTDPAQEYYTRQILSSEGVFCDPQIGCADRLVAVDLATARSRQFSQEFRLYSNSDGPLNFSLGANFLRFDTQVKYYVFVNSLSLWATRAANAPADSFIEMRQYVPGVTDNSTCLYKGFAAPDPFITQTINGCQYVDPNPITSLNDLGHNYFLSNNPYKLISYAVFGELYYKLADNLKVTAGLRWTVDKKEAPRIPSWILSANNVGYPVSELVEQEWREPTGRLTVDWKPNLSFTDETLLYASYARGYKAGGANPPPAGVTCFVGCGGNEAQAAILESATHPKTFDAEFVNAFELGAKNTLLDGKLTLNTAAFYYDYEGYQISQIIDRSAVNSNFDATVWGLEIEADWRLAENFKIGLKGGYENTRVADGMRAIDIMDRTAGDPHWVVVRPFPTFPSNCVLPEWLFLGNPSGFGQTNPALVNVGGRGGGNNGGCEEAYVLHHDPATGGDFALYPFRPAGNQLGEFFRVGTDYTAWSTNLEDYPCWPNDPDTGEPVPFGNEYPGVDPACLANLSNNGDGFYADLSGNSLPNAPHYTATITADYTVPLAGDWLMTLHTDLYYQSEAWTRIFNVEGYDKLKAYTNVNLAAIITNEPGGWYIMAFIKNVMDRDSITGAFLNSDDTGLTTNVFLTEPRLYGLRVTKEWTGSGWWTGANPNHAAGEPYPLTVELGGQVQRQDAPYEPLSPFPDGFPSGLDPLLAQNRDLDWGDGREAKVTYRPSGSSWSVSFATRYGRTNSETARLHQEIPAADERHCAFFYPFGALFCEPDGPLYTPNAITAGSNWSDASAVNREQHTMADFAVGKDLGLGLFGQSTVSAGLRYANFKSDTRTTIAGVPDWELMDGWIYYYLPHHRYAASLSAEREFEGEGPTLSWASAVELLGSDQTGHVTLDWSAGGGVLFGKQKTSAEGFEQSTLLYSVYLFSQPDDPALLNPPVPVDIRREDSTTVPFVDLSLGLSYEIQRIKVSTGYRWERYFDVLDVGYGEAKDGDRTIDGPYFKLSVGFGG